MIVREKLKQAVLPLRKKLNKKTA